MQRQLQLDCSCHFTGRDIYQSYSIVFIYGKWHLMKTHIWSGVWSHDTDMLFLLLKNAKDSSLAESSCLTLALATHTKKIKYFDG